MRIDEHATCDARTSNDAYTSASLTNSKSEGSIGVNRNRGSDRVGLDAVRVDQGVVLVRVVENLHALVVVRKEDVRRTSNVEHLIVCP